MKGRKGSSRSKGDLQAHWEKAAKFYESDESLSVLEAGAPVDAIERRKLLGPGRKKLVAVRLPEDDIESLKVIAKRHHRKYQQLVVQAVEQFLDKYQEMATGKKKAM